MKLCIPNSLILHVASNRAFVALLSNRARKIAIRPKLPYSKRNFARSWARAAFLQELHTVPNGLAHPALFWSRLITGFYAGYKNVVPLPRSLCTAYTSGITTRFDRIRGTGSIFSENRGRNKVFALDVRNERGDKSCLTGRNILIYQRFPYPHLRISQPDHPLWRFLPGNALQLRPVPLATPAARP